MPKSMLVALLPFFVLVPNAAAVAAPAARVEIGDEEDLAASRTAIRANAVVQGFDFAGVGLEISQTVARNFEVEASLDGVNLGRGYVGMYGQATARYGYFGPWHSLSVGAGLGVLDSASFGDVTFAMPELAYEYRPLHGVSIGAGFAVPVTLNDSSLVPCEDSGFLACFLETTQFHQGDVSLRARVAVGYSF